MTDIYFESTKEMARRNIHAMSEPDKRKKRLFILLIFILTLA